MYGFAPGIPTAVWFSRRTTQDEEQAGMISDGFFPNFSLMSVNGVLKVQSNRAQGNGSYC
jgi:hypothetical protein